MADGAGTTKADTCSNRTAASHSATISSTSARLGKAARQAWRSRPDAGRAGAAGSFKVVLMLIFRSPAHALP